MLSETDLSSKVLVKLLGGNTPVVLVGLVFVEVNAVLLSGDAFEEGGAATAWRAKDDEHFAGVHKSVYIVQDVNATLLSPCEGGEQAPELQKSVANGFLVVRVLQKSLLKDGIAASMCSSTYGANYKTQQRVSGWEPRHHKTGSSYIHGLSNL